VREAFTYTVAWWATQAARLGLVDDIPKERKPYSAALDDEAIRDEQPAKLELASAMAAEATRNGLPFKRRAI
jgi:hypothetical protein